MKRFLALASLAVATISFAGCKPAVELSSSNTPPSLPTQAQGKLPTIKLWIGAQEMTTEMAVTPMQEETGMMFRTNMGPNEGMIFVFPQPVKASFWMKNTVLPLSAAYISPAGTIIEIHDLKPEDTNSVIAATANILFVLETPQGWFQKNNIGVNTVVTTERGPLHKVFFGQ